jgi:hypothetical protein
MGGRRNDTPFTRLDMDIFRSLRPSLHASPDLTGIVRYLLRRGLRAVSDLTWDRIAKMAMSVLTWLLIVGALLAAGTTVKWARDYPSIDPSIGPTASLARVSAPAPKG